MISRSVLICAKGSARETSATRFLILVGLKFTAINVISCWSRCTLATSLGDPPARKLPSPDRPEHRHRSQCTQWDRCTVEALHRTSGVHRHRRGLSPDGYNPPGTHLHKQYPLFRCKVRR